MSETAVGDAASEDRPRWRRRLIAGVLLVLGLGVGYVLYWYQSSLKRLERALADADRLDPGWRFEELEAKRAVIADDQNSALVIPLVRKQIDKQVAETGSWLKVETQPLGDRPAAVQLPEKEIKLLREDLQRAAGALAEARRLVDLPRGRIPVSPARNIWSYPVDLDHIQTIRTTTTLLGYDAMLRAQDGDLNGALQSCRAMMNAARSIGDEPTAISMLVRIACRAAALHQLERVLAQGQACEKELLVTQRLLEADAQEPLLLTSARGERAYCHEMMQVVKAGHAESTLEKLVSQPDGGLLHEVRSPIAFFTWPNDHAVLLEHMNRFVEIARLPLQQQAEPMKELEARLKDKNQPALVRLLAPTGEKVFEAHRKAQAMLDCSIVAVAAERYRLAHGRWPESLEQLPPTFLSKVPDDPYGKGPIRLGKTQDGLVIYSLFIDRVDNGGKVGDFRPVSGNDIGIRLWDVKARRQPAVKTPGQGEK